MNGYFNYKDELMHYGVLGMKWGVRRYQPYGKGGYEPKRRVGSKSRKNLDDVVINKAKKVIKSKVNSIKTKEGQKDLARTAGGLASAAYMIDQAKQLGNNLFYSSQGYHNDAIRGFDIRKIKELPRVIKTINYPDFNLEERLDIIRDDMGLRASLDNVINLTGGALVKSIVTDAALTVGNAAVAGILGTVAASVTMASVNAVIKAVKENKKENKQNSKKKNK